MKYLALDYGHTKIGIAISDPEGNFAYPHSVVVMSKEAVGEITALCQTEQIKKIVMGESLNLKGEPNHLMKQIKDFSDKLMIATGLPIVFEPEFYTTQEADRLIGRDGGTDARAAALILRSYLDKNRGK